LTYRHLIAALLVAALGTVALPAPARAAAGSATTTKIPGGYVHVPVGSPAGNLRAVSETISLDEAAQLLEITPDRVQVMVEEGLLDPVPGDGPARFDPAQVRALHDLGG
jgi:hypothetical protein